MTEDTKNTMSLYEFTHKLALAALLHDIGKIGQRAYVGIASGNLPPNVETELFPKLKLVENEVAFLSHARSLVSSCFSSEITTSGETSINDKNLINVLNVLRLPNHDFKTIKSDLNEISLQVGIEINENQKTEKTYKTLWNEVSDKSKSIRQDQNFDDKSVEKALMLLEWYGWSVPASNFEVLPDTSLAEHSKAVAILAAATGRLYMSLNDADRADLKQDLSITQEIFEGCCLTEDIDKVASLPGFECKLPSGACYQLVIGDLTGIQNFIYDINTKNAARNLKGRSFAIEMWTDRIAANILAQFEMPSACRVYATGGKFLLILPNLPATEGKEESETTEKLQTLAAKINDDIRNEYPNCSVRFKYAALPMKQGHLASKFFGQLLDELMDKLGKVSRKPELSRSGFAEIFEPKEPNYWQIKTDEVDPLDTPFINFGKNLSKKNGLAIYAQKTESEDSLKIPGFDEWIKVIDVTTNARENSKLIISFNKFDSYADGFRWYSGIECAEWPDFRDIDKSPFWKNFHVSAKKAAEIADPCDNSMDYGALIQFDHLGLAAKQMTGFNRIGILRMDVDNLGIMFSQGLKAYEEYTKSIAPANNKEQMRDLNIYTLSRIMSVSNMLIRFFGGALPKIMDTPIDAKYLDCKEEVITYKDLVNVIYAGGDDAFLVGPWNLMPDLALLIEENFRKWHGENPDLTISAGIAITDGKYPISVAADDAGKAESQAKKHIVNHDKHDKHNPNIKSNLHFLETSASWQQWFIINKLKNELKQIVENDYDKGILTLCGRTWKIFNEQKKLFIEQDRKETDRNKSMEISNEDSFLKMVRNLEMLKKWNAFITYSLNRYNEQKREHIKNFTDLLVSKNAQTCFFAEDIKHFQNYQPIEFLGVITRWCDYTIRKGIHKSEEK